LKNTTDVVEEVHSRLVIGNARCKSDLARERFTDCRRSKPSPAELEFPALGGATAAPVQRLVEFAPLRINSSWSPLGSAALAIGEEIEIPETVTFSPRHRPP